MTVRTNQLQIIKVIVLSIPIFMMHLQDLIFIISTSLADFASLLKETQFQCSLIYYFIFSSCAVVFNASPLPVRAGSTASVSISSCQYLFAALWASDFFSARDAIAGLTAISSAATCFQVYWSSINWLVANIATCVWASWIMLRH